MDRRERNPGRILAGTFLILFGLAFTLAGGACTIVWFSILYWAWGIDVQRLALFWLLVAIVCSGLGVLAIEHGIRSLRRPRGGGEDEVDQP